MTLCKVVYQHAGGDTTAMTRGARAAARKRSLWPLKREELLWELCMKSQQDGEVCLEVFLREAEP